MRQFERVDRPLSDPETRWTHAGAYRAEAGFQDPSLGWISVRAERHSGEVHAFVTPSSDAGEMVLDAHLGGLNAHLAKNDIHVHPVTIDATHESRPGLGFGAEAQQGFGGGTGHSNSGTSSERNRAHVPIEPGIRLVRSHESDQREFTSLPMNGMNSGGTYISLMA